MNQAIPVFVINLARREDRLERVSHHLEERGVAFTRVDACDATKVDEAVLDGVITPSGPLGALGLGDRSCTVSHTYGWEAFLQTGARFGLMLEDDVFLSGDVSNLLRADDWIPSHVDVIKLEKFGSGISKVLLGDAEIKVPGTERALHRMYSRHVGGGAYILSRRAAQIALSYRGRMRVPIDHFLFNDTVSPVFRQLKPFIVQPAMATQRHYEYNSDIAKFGKAARPTGWRLKLRKLRRGWNEISQIHRQLVVFLTKRGAIREIFWKDSAP